LSLGDVTLQAPHAALDIAQSVVPAAPLEQPPQRMRIEDADIAAPARHLDRSMPHGGARHHQIDCVDYSVPNIRIL
ncbi:MAG: hypothetical protein IE917_16465, partial [Betaproteobacteria bacterium]|nr:hypothetical protein [Betaproteobacteria bacterium]